MDGHDVSCMPWLSTSRQSIGHFRIVERLCWRWCGPMPTNVRILTLWHLLNAFDQSHGVCVIWASLWSGTFTTAIVISFVCLGAFIASSMPIHDFEIGKRTFYKNHIIILLLLKYYPFQNASQLFKQWCWYFGQEQKSAALCHSWTAISLVVDVKLDNFIILTYKVKVQLSINKIIKPPSLYQASTKRRHEQIFAESTSTLGARNVHRTG